MALPITRRNPNEDVSRRDPFSELDRINRQLSGYLDNWRDLPDLLGEGFTPLADVEEQDDAYLVEVELPGMRKDDVDIELSGGRLTVTGERKEKERVGVLRRRERTVGRFRYEVLLPREVNEDGVVADLEHGVLTVVSRRQPVPSLAASR